MGEKGYSFYLLDEEKVKIRIQSTGELIEDQAYVAVFRETDTVSMVTFKGKEATLFGRGNPRDADEPINTAVNCLFSVRLFGPVVVIQKKTGR